MCMETRPHFYMQTSCCTQDLALEFLSTNLHHLICVITDQALAIGDTRGYLELWLERMMGFVKRKTKFRTTNDPEKVVVNEISLHLGFERLKEGGPVSELPNLFQGSSTAYSHPDTGPRSQQSHFLLGAGYSWCERKHGMSLSVLLTKVKSELVTTNGGDCHGWTNRLLSTPSELDVYVHDRAMFHDREILTSRSYGKEKSRDSCHVSARYMAEDNMTERDHIALVRRFVRISHTQLTNLMPLRFALVDFYKYRDPIVDNDLGVVHQVAVNEFDHRECNFPVPFSAIGQKLVHCTSGNKMYLVKYNINSGLF